MSRTTRCGIWNWRKRRQNSVRPRPTFGLGHEYLSGENLPRDYEKAYSCFIKGKDVDWVPIDPEENTEYEIDGEVEVTSEGLLLQSYGDIGWWLFVPEKHPSLALKCGLADWHMKQGGDVNRKRALKLLEESVNEGSGFHGSCWLRCRCFAARAGRAPYRFGRES